MREVLYRGKTKQGEWVYGQYCELKDGKTTIPCIYYQGEIIKETLCQFTGLTDKNGKKIFEGDIIRYADMYKYEIYLESLEQPENLTDCFFDNMWTVDKVVYCIEHSYPAFDLSSHDFESNGLYELKESKLYHYEIIGNIHDNPELLEGGAEFD